MHTAIRPDTSRWKSLASTCLLVAAWLYANRSELEWLFESFRYASPLNLMLAALVGGVLLVQLVRVNVIGQGNVQRSHLMVSATPNLRPYPLFLMLGSGVGAIALRWLIDIEQINVFLFALGTYGLCGLFLTPDLWRKGLPVAVLVALIVPFSAQFGSGLGFPVRVMTAQAVEQLLAAWHVSAISSHDIIILENGIAHIDLPCSGLKSLWTGTLFLLAATWLERRQFGMRWLLVWASSLLLLVWANTMRVLLLVLITQVWQQPQIAEILHVPLGVIGFVGACALTWLLLQKVPKHSRQIGGEDRSIEVAQKGNRKLVGLVAVVMAIALLSQLRPPQVNQNAIAPIQWPERMLSEPVPLTQAEQRFFDNSANPIVQKQRFVLSNLSGSILTVTTTSWHAHHPPELCFVGNGLKVERMERKQLTPEVQARWLSLQEGKLSATYWFQSPKQTTDDFLSRIWSYIVYKNKTWVLVSILFDNSYTPESSEIQGFTATVHKAIARSVNGG